MRKAQFWYADFVIGVLVIGFIAVLFAITIVDVPEKTGQINILSGDAAMISNLLMSPGIDNSQWVNGQGKIGLVKDGKVNNIWLNDFLKLVEQTNPSNGYQIAKSMLGTEHDFAIYFQDKNGNVFNSKAYGGIDDLGQLGNLNAENIVRINRIVYFDDNNDGYGQVVNMVVIAWDYGEEKRTSKVVCENANNCGFCGILGVLLADYKQGCVDEWSYCDGTPAGDPALCPA